MSLVLDFVLATVGCSLSFWLGIWCGPVVFNSPLASPVAIAFGPKTSETCCACCCRQPAPTLERHKCHLAVLADLLLKSEASSRSAEGAQELQQLLGALRHFPLVTAPVPYSPCAAVKAAEGGDCDSKVTETQLVPASQLFLALQPGLEHMQGGLVASGMRFVHPELVRGCTSCVLMWFFWHRLLPSTHASLVTSARHAVACQQNGCCAPGVAP